MLCVCNSYTPQNTYSYIEEFGSHLVSLFDFLKIIDKILIHHSDVFSLPNKNVKEQYIYRGNNDVGMA